jgi:predicted acetyltransferase
MTIELYLVPIEEKQHLARLVDAYLPIHCRHQDIRVGPESVEDYIYFPEYWREQGRYPYYIKQESIVVGFVLVRTVFDEDGIFYQVSDFYVKPEFQRQGLGEDAVSLLWKKYPGAWELYVLRKNLGARHFWNHCSDRHAVDKVEIAEVSGKDGLGYQYNFEV